MTDTFFGNTSHFAVSKKKTSENSKNSVLAAERVLYRTRSSSSLFNNRRLQNTIQQIHARVRNEVEYNFLYKALYDSFARFVQQIPVLADEKSNVLMLVIGMKRATSVLEQLDSVEAESKDPLFRFAAFSAILLRDLGSIDMSRDILCCNDKGEVQSIWNPIEGPMVVGEHYSIRYKEAGSKKVSGWHAVAYALEIMPKKGLDWLKQENALLYEMWLAYLSGQEELWGDFGSMLERVAIKTGNLAELDTVPEGLSQEQMQEMMFLAWLKAQIASKKITVNKKGSSVQVFAKGAWIDSAVLKKFAQASGKKAASISITLRTSHNNLGGVFYGEHDKAYQKVHGPMKKQGKSGIYMANKRLLGAAISGVGVSAIGVKETANFSSFLSKSGKEVTQKKTLSSLFKESVR
jgi:hypothetical protein